jgi:DNA excision repair protein ERCC-4
MRNALPAELPIDKLVALVDTREQAPLELAPLASEAATLATGDYSLRGLEHVIAVERKSLPDLLGCVGRERERFDREVQRLLAYPVRALVVESSWQQIESGGWRGEILPQAVLGSLLGWIALGLPVIMAENHQMAGRYVARLLVIAARRRWRELRDLAVCANPE